MEKVFILEARKENGDLDVKRIWKTLFVNWPAYWVPVALMSYLSKQHVLENHWHTGVTDQQLYDFYFVANPDVDSVGWDTLVEFYKGHWLSIRPKTW